MQDFMMTNQFVAKTTQRKMAEVEQATGSRKAAEHIGVLFSVRESYLEALMNVIDQEFDGMDVFLEKEMGLSDAARERLVELYTW